MTTLNKNTKKARGFINSYRRAREELNTSIYSIYEHPSSIKVNIAREIEQRAGKAQVYYFGGNSFTFTCGYVEEGTGELFIETKSNIYRIVL